MKNDWLKHCDKKKAECEAKDQDAIANWWGTKVINPYALIEKEKHHTFLKEFLKDKIQEAGGSLQVSGKKKHQPDDGVLMPKLLDAPTSEEETTAAAEGIIQFCKGQNAYNWYIEQWNNTVDKSTLNYTMEDIEGLKHIHHAAPKALRKLLAGRNVLLHGPTGCGKSYLAKQLRMLLAACIGDRKSTRLNSSH